MKIKTFWNTTLGETTDWPSWLFAVWFAGQAVLIAGVIVGAVLLACTYA